MAKRKLSPEQRITIRKEIRQFLAQKMKPTEIQKLVAKKYGITTITARWYLKSVRGPQSSSAGRSKTSKPAKHTISKKTRKPHAQNNDSTALTGSLHRLVSNLHTIAANTFSRARQAKKLVPQWQAYVRKEITLKKLESRVRRELHIVSTKAKTLHRAIRRLTSQ